jgi:flavorubredoxin
MQTTTHEIGDGIFRFSTCIADAGPGGFTFNQFLVRADEPLLFHTGMKALFPLVSAAVARVVPLSSLRWITFGHYEADECGAMNDFLGVAPRAEVAHGAVGCMIALHDQCLRPPRVLADGEVLDLGGKRVRHIDTPHVPHCWDARALYEETTATLFSGDLFAHLGDGPALTTGDIVGPALVAEDNFAATSLGPMTAPTMRRLADLQPRTLAVMHGSSTATRCSEALRALADAYEARFRAAM